MKVFQKIKNPLPKPLLVENLKEAATIRKGLNKYFYNLKKGIGKITPVKLLNNRELVRYCIFVLDSEKEYKKKLYLYAHRKRLNRKRYKRAARLKTGFLDRGKRKAIVEWAELRLQSLS